MRLETFLLRAENARLIRVIVFVAGFIIFGLYAVILGQDNNWDLRNYHFYNPYAFLNGRLTFDFAPAQLQSYLNPLIDLPFYFLVTHLRPVLVGFFMGGLQGLNIGFIFMIVYLATANQAPRMRLGISLLLAGFGTVGPVFQALCGATNNDTLVSIFVLAAVYVLVQSLATHGTVASPEGRKALLTAGLLMGLGVGLKLTVATYAIGCTLALLAMPTTLKRAAGLLGIWAAAGVTGVLLSRGHWMATLWSQYGNPVLPFYNSIFKSPYFGLFDVVDARYLPKTFWDAITYPFHFLTRTNITYLTADFRDARYAIIYILVLLFIILLYYRRSGRGNLSQKEKKRLPRVTDIERFLLVFFISSYILWQLKFSIIRYVAPLEALGAVIIYILVRNIFYTARQQLAAVSIALVIIVVVAKPPVVVRLPWTPIYFAVEPPPLEDPDNTIIIIAGKRPWAYMIPLFDPGVRFVRIGGNFTRPDWPNLFKSEMRAVMQNHSGPLYIMSRPQFIRQEISFLAYYGLVITDGTCAQILSKHEPPGLCLWRVNIKPGGRLE